MLTISEMPAKRVKSEALDQDLVLLAKNEHLDIINPESKSDDTAAHLNGLKRHKIDGPKWCKFPLVFLQEK